MNSNETKSCGKCLASKPLTSFYSWNCKSTGKIRIYSLCKTCQIANHAAMLKTPHGKAKDRGYKLVALYGISQQAYDSLLKTQEGRCAICGTDRPGGPGRFHVDHCHKTKVIRALLCSRCNTGLGCFRDNPSLLDLAAEYLREFISQKHSS